MYAMALEFGYVYMISHAFIFVFPKSYRRIYMSLMLILRLSNKLERWITDNLD